MLTALDKRDHKVKVILFFPPVDGGAQCAMRMPLTCIAAAGSNGEMLSLLLLCSLERVVAFGQSAYGVANVWTHQQPTQQQWLQQGSYAQQLPAPTVPSPYDTGQQTYGGSGVASPASSSYGTEQQTYGGSGVASPASSFYGTEQQTYGGSGVAPTAPSPYDTGQQTYGASVAAPPAPPPPQQQLYYNDYAVPVSNNFAYAPPSMSHTPFASNLDAQNLDGAYNGYANIMTPMSGRTNDCYEMFPMLAVVNVAPYERRSYISSMQCADICRNQIKCRAFTYQMTDVSEV